MRVEGRTLRYDYWTKAGMAAGVVSVEVERDAETGKVLGPWDFTDNWHRGGANPPTLLDGEPHAKCPEPDPDVEVTLEFKPFPMRPLSSVFFTQSFPMLEEQSLASIVPVDDQMLLTQVKDERRENLIKPIQQVPKPNSSLQHTRDYAGGYGRKGFVIEPLPDGALPVYDPVPVHSGQGHEMVNITAVMNGTRCICYRCSKYEGCPNTTTNESDICDDCAAGGPHKGFDEKK